MSCKPLLLLDVDGVLRPLGGSNATAELVIDGPDFEVINFDPELPARLGRLADRFELTWATMWERDANRHLAPALGLPPLKWVAFDDEEGSPGVSAKLPAVQRFVADRAFAWADDDLGNDVVKWCSERSIPSLALEIDPTTGLCDSHVEELIAFARQVQFMFTSQHH